jgi:5-methylcytosine-specific restriction endonuclease McrBC GTP-binding regulatory subunit McrB
MGCRLFFCDETSRDWQSAEYEKRLVELKEIHAEYGVEYRYIEWLSALKSVSPALGSGDRAAFGTIDRAPFIDPRRLTVIESE